MQTVVERVFGCQEGHDTLSRRIITEVRDQMAQVVLFALTDRAVGDKDVGVLSGQTPDGVVGVDPGLDPGRGIKLSSGWSELGGGRRGRTP